MPRKTRIDGVDRILLKALSENSRTRNVELAGISGLAMSSIATRIAWLEDQDILQGYTAIIGGGPAGLLDQIAFFKLDPASPIRRREFELYLKDIEAITSITRMAGASGYAIRGFGGCFPDQVLDAAGRFGLNVASVKTAVIEREVKPLRGLPLSAWTHHP